MWICLVKPIALISLRLYRIRYIYISPKIKPISHRFATMSSSMKEHVLGSIQRNMGRGNTGRGDMGRGNMGRGDMGRGNTGRGDTGRGNTGRGDTGRGNTGRGDTGRGNMGRR